MSVFVYDEVSKMNDKLRHRMSFHIKILLWLVKHWHGASYDKATKLLLFISIFQLFQRPHVFLIDLTFIYICEKQSRYEHAGTDRARKPRATTKE